MNRASVRVDQLASILQEKSEGNTPYVKMPNGDYKFVGGAAMARRNATMPTRRKATRILRPGEVEKSKEVLPAGLSSYERFFAALLRSEATEFLKNKSELWNTICMRLGLAVPQAPILPSYSDQKQHFAVRAALVMEEARHAIFEGLVKLRRQLASCCKEPNTASAERTPIKSPSRKDSYSRMLVALDDAKFNESTKHSVVSFRKESASLSPKEMTNLRPGTVLACVNVSLAPTIANARLGCVLPANREEIIESKSFPVMIFGQVNPNESGWELFPICSLLSEHRKFEACTDVSNWRIPFLHALLGGKGSTHTRFEDEEIDGSGYLSAEYCFQSSLKSDLADEGNTQTGFSPQRNSEPFKLPALNAMQEKAATKFLSSASNTITLVQGYVNLSRGVSSLFWPQPRTNSISSIYTFSIPNVLVQTSWYVLPCFTPID